MGYEATKFEDNSFDVILGNIPFNSVKIYDRRYNDLNPYIHDYFFIKSLDLAKPGGIIAFITSKGIMIARTRAFGNISTAGRVHRRHSPTQHSVQGFGGNRCNSGCCFLEKESAAHRT